ncbi:DUF4442 domain-containing protein [Moraxella marmotae]|uniref:DUF4442 domain-containing protein n=1 Tax=Moraxella marmotae TaxID=3344520 RepID=UPI0035F4A0B6
MFANTRTKLGRFIKTGKKTTYPQLLPLFIKNRLNAYPPFVGAGIRVRTLDFDNGLCVVELPLTRLNRYTDGTQFTGSIMMMTEPLLKIMLMHRLGKDYLVADKQATVEFLDKATSSLTARLKIDTAEILQIMDAVKSGDTVRSYTIDITDNQQKIVAKVTKTLAITAKK